MVVEELQDFGLEEMDRDQMRSFVSTRRVGVLGLPTGEGPYLLPMSFGFDGEDRVYFTYLTDDASRKVDLTDATDEASLLVFSLDSLYNWESVLLRGDIERVPETAWDDVMVHLEDAWTPDLIRSALASVSAVVYELRVTDWSGVKHGGLPPGLEPQSE